MKKTILDQPSAQDLLSTMLYQAILEAEKKLGRTPSKEEILDHLFSGERSDPEARELARLLDHLMGRLLANWSAMIAVERTVAGAVVQLTIPESSVPKALAPVSSCKGTCVASDTVSVTLARSKPWIVPRLQARFWPL